MVSLNSMCEFIRLSLNPSYKYPKNVVTLICLNMQYNSWDRIASRRVATRHTKRRVYVGASQSVSQSISSLSQI